MNLLEKIKKLFIGLLLFSISIVLFIPLAIWGIIELLISLFWKKHFINGLSQFGEFFKLIATIIDVTGNVVCKVPFNRLLITDKGYRFGSRFDTISYVLGVNQMNGTLANLGKYLCNILNWIDKEHCIKTVQNRKKTLI